MDKEELEIFTDLAEDLAIEIMAEFSQEDFKHISKTALRLMRAAEIINRHNAEVPFVVQEAVRVFKSSMS